MYHVLCNKDKKTGTINRQSHTMKYKLLLFIKNNGEQGATCFGS